MTAARTVILVHSASVRDALQQVYGSAPWALDRNLELQTASGDPRMEVARLREEEPRVPLGYLGAHPSAALAALEAGADESGVATEACLSQLATFVDRLEVRAQMRAQGQRLQDTLAHAERLTALGTLVAGVGHEINNPLSSIMLYLHAARHYLLPELGPKAATEAVSMLDDMGAAADAIATIVRDLRVFARTDENEPAQVVDAEDLVEQALRMIGSELPHNAALERDYAQGLPKIVVPRNRVTQVLVNVLVNAVHAIRELERDEHRIRISTRADEDSLVIAVSDTGPGIAQEQLTRIFDPFFTTKREEIGTGLGLSISRTILRRIGGELTVDSIYGEGATFVCVLPLPTREMTRDAFKHTGSPIPKGLRRAASILIIDGDPRIRRSYARALSDSYRIVTAADGTEAIELLESGTHVDAVVLELALPEQDGRTVLSWLAAHRPALRKRALIVTAAGSSTQFGDFLRTTDEHVLHKPVRGDALLAALQERLNA
jgi:signal transduction histidine kinase